VATPDSWQLRSSISHVLNGPIIIRLIKISPSFVMSFFCIYEERNEILSGDVTAAVLLADWRVMLATIQSRAF
jgi:hypothetical protein